MSRPRRSIQTINYAESPDSELSDAEDSGQTASPFFQSDDSAYEDLEALESHQEKIFFAPIPHYTLSNAEREVAEAAVVETKSQLLSISLEEAKLVRSLNKMQSSIVTLKKRIDKQRRSLARVGFLPRDVLATIFVFVHDPWPPSCVNRWWRKVACTTASLWTKIYAAFCSVPNTIDPEERINCFRLDCLEFVLKNSQNAELDLKLHFCSQRCDQETRYEEMSDTNYNVGLISLLKTFNVYPRIRRLQVDEDTSRELGQGSTDEISFSKLQAVDVEGDSVSFQERLAADAPCLSELSLRNSYNGPTMEKRFARWMQMQAGSLRQLRIVALYFTNPHCFAYGISALHSLRELVLKRTRVASSIPDPPRVAFTSLERLELIDTVLSWPMTFPKLTNLVINHSMLLSGEKTPISLSNLTNLVWKRQQHQDRTAIRCPRLQNLTIALSNIWDDYITMTETIKVPSIRSLTICGGPQYRWWLHILLSNACFEGLKQLKIMNSLRKEFYEALAGCRMDRNALTARKPNAAKMSWKELEWLEIDYQLIREKKYDTSLRLWGPPAFSSRQSSPRALRTLKVRYEGEEDWVSF